MDTTELHEKPLRNLIISMVYAFLPITFPVLLILFLWKEAEIYIYYNVAICLLAVISYVAYVIVLKYIFNHSSLIKKETLKEIELSKKHETEEFQAKLNLYYRLESLKQENIRMILQSLAEKHETPPNSEEKVTKYEINLTTIPNLSKAIEQLKTNNLL